jgi:hypothetical protein
MTEFHVGDRVSVKPEHDEVLIALGRPTGPGTITDIMDGCIIVAEDGEAEEGVWSEGGGTSAPYEPEQLVLIECRVQTAIQQGVFVDEDDAVAQEAAWAEQMAQEMALVPAATAEVAVVESREVESYPDDIDPPLDPLDIPDHYDLPMHGSILACPKCGSDQRTEDGKVKGIRTVYHQHGVLHAPCGDRFGWPDVQNLGEHLCRICERCKYGWPEAVWHGSA